MRDALSGMFNVADLLGTVTLDSPAWVPGLYALPLNLTESVKHANRDDTYDLHCLVDGVFA